MRACILPSFHGMANGPNFRASVLAARQRVAEGREKIRLQHAKGAPGVQVCARLTELIDGVVFDLYREALDSLGFDDLHQHVALAPHGGYGRRQLAPYSDLDLMILHSGNCNAQVAALAKRLMQDLYDIGLQPGHSVRTPTEAAQLARDDATICTSQFEARFLAGNEEIFRDFAARQAKLVQRRFKPLHEAIVVARRQERAQYGETVYLLAPNVKRSRGALREIQLLRWIGFAKFGASDPDLLHMMGALSKFDHQILRNALAFLLRLRNEMHFHAGKAYDTLDRHEQVRIAEVFGYLGGSGLLPVEQFMREYFRHTSQVRNLVSRFVRSVRPTAAVAQVLAPVFSHLVEGDYRVGKQYISATKQGLSKLKFNLEEVLRLCDLANLYDKTIEPSTWDAVARAAPTYAGELTPGVARRFLSLLAQPMQLAPLLRKLHELRVLEKIIPAFNHARCLLQFNEYHKYTVDEHSFRAVQAAADFGQDPRTLGQVYRSLRQKRTLHLALLIHDLGKGFAEDHSEIGLVIADDTARRLDLPAHEAEMVKFLVHKHLSMAHLAFRRDTSDDQLVLQFAVEVGSPEMLKMLFVLTCADLAAVGPGVLNDWKVEVLTALYQRAMRHLAGDADGAENALSSARERVRAVLRREQDGAWFDAQLDVLPTTYLRAHTPDQIAETLRRLRRLKTGEAAAWAEYQHDTQTVEVTAILSPQLESEAFSHLTGALSSQGLAILSADINTLADGMVLDRFIVQDADFAGAPPEPRLRDVAQGVVDAVQQRLPPKFRKLWGSEPSGALSPLKTAVKFDNSTSDKYTVLDIFTFDRRGLLYTIARTLVELQLSISVAKIGTHLDQVVDVFYVTDPHGAKIEDETRLEAIRQRLLAAIDGAGEG